MNTDQHGQMNLKRCPSVVYKRTISTRACGELALDLCVPCVLLRKKSAQEEFALENCWRLLFKKNVGRGEVMNPFPKIPAPVPRLSWTRRSRYQIHGVFSQPFHRNVLEK